MTKFNAKTVASKVGNHLNRHKFTYAAGAVAIAAIAIQQENLKLFKSFLIEKGIDPVEYFNPESLAELNV